MTSCKTLWHAPVIFLAGALLFSGSAFAGSAEAGRYIFDLAGCEGCHTDVKGDKVPLAGARAFKTDYGTFYSPNITPDPETGIGKWSLDDFRLALSEGIGPDGAQYYPAFPYTSYTRMSARDVEDLWAYLQTTPSVSKQNRPHELSWPYSWRWTVGIWKMLYLDTGPAQGWSRGRYVMEALSHCQECHTPRDGLGGLEGDMAYAGAKRNPEGISIPNITPDRDTGVGKWTKGDFEMLFTIGMLPDNDFVGGVMAESVSHSTSRMTPVDRAALMAYLRGLKPIANRINPPKSADSGDSDW